MALPFPGKSPGSVTELCVGPARAYYVLCALSVRNCQVIGGGGWCLSCRGSAVRNNPAGVNPGGAEHPDLHRSATQPWGGGGVPLTPTVKIQQKIPATRRRLKCLLSVWPWLERIWKSIHCDAQTSGRFHLHPHPASITTRAQHKMRMFPSSPGLPAAAEEALRG